MTAFATQSNIDMSGPGLLGSDVVGSSRRKSKRITIGTGLTLFGGALSNSLDLSGYVQKTSSTGSLILPSGTTAERDGSPAAGYSRWNTTTSRFERWTGSIWENYVRLSGDTMTGALSLGSNGLTCGAITASDNFTFPNSGTYSIRNASATYGISITSGAGGLLRSIGSFGIGTSNDVILARAAAGVLADRNGINAQCFLLNKTYTSDASQEALMLDAGKQISGKLGLYSYRGSSGGSNYPIQIGMLAADGSTFTGLTVAIDGGVSAAKIGAGGAAYANYPLTVNGSAIFRDPTGVSFVCFHGNSGTWMGTADDNYAFASYRPSIYFFTNGEYASTASAAIALHSGSVTLGKALVPKTLADSAAPNGSVYYSSDAAKLVFKDAGGTVHELY